MSTATAETKAPQLPEGMVLYKNTDPNSWGGRIVRNGKTIQIGAEGHALAQDDSALHLCGPEWQVIQGEPKVIVVQHRGGVEIRPTPGPMKVWSCPAGYGGQRIAARDGSVLFFNQSGYALAPENCGLDVVPGYEIVADGVEAEKYQAHPPITLGALEESIQQARLSGLGVEMDDDEEDAYAALARELARKPVVEPESAVQDESETSVPEAAVEPAAALMSETETPEPAEDPRADRKSVV